MKIKLKILFTAVCISLTLQVNAIQSIQIEKNAALTLNDCIKIALNNSPVVKKYILNLDIAKSSVGVAKSAYFPSLSLGTSYKQNFGERSHNFGSYQSRTLPGFDASLSQLLWNFGKTDANIRMEKFNRIAAEFDFDETILTTIFNVKLQYYGVLAARSLMEVERLNVQINERNYQRTLAYFDEGIKSKIDLVNAEVNLSDSKVSFVKAENTYKNAIVSLNNAMYVAYAPEYSIQNTETFNLSNPYVPMSLTNINNYKKLLATPEDISDAVYAVKAEKSDVLKNYSFEKYPYTFEKSVEIAKENRPDLKALNASVKAMKQYVLLTKRQYLPDLKGGVGYSYANNRYYADSGMNVSLNLSSTFNIMQVKNEVDIANSQLNLAKTEVELLNQNLYFDIQSAYVDMIQLEKQIPLLETKVRQTLENLELADGRYAVGLGDYIQLQDARVNYNNAQSSYVQAVYNYNVARATLEREIALPQENTLTVEDVKDYQKDLKKEEAQIKKQAKTAQKKQKNKKNNKKRVEKKKSTYPSEDEDVFNLTWDEKEERTKTSTTRKMYERSEDKISESKIDKTTDKEKEFFGKRIVNFLKKCYNRCKNFITKIRKITNKMEMIGDLLEDEDIIDAVKRIKRYGVNGVKLLLPQKLNAKIIFGFEDPYYTGKVLGWTAALIPIYGDHINITPDFEKRILKGELKIKGRIRRYKILHLLWKVYKDKDELIKQKDRAIRMIGGS